MSCFDVQILDPNINTIEIETCIGNQPSSIDIVSYDNSSIIEINHCIALSPSEINDLITVKDILAGSGIGVSSSSGNFTISVTGTFDLTSEEVDDRVNQLLNAGNYIDLNYNDNLNTLTISVTGVQPSGNYSITGHSHVITDVSGLQNALDNKQPSGSYASLVHSHLSSDITNFNSGVSGLLPSVTGIGQAVSSFVNNTYTINVSGLQPSGNYSLVGHTHIANDITNFNSSVSGLLPVTNILAGNNIGVSSSGSVFTVAVTGQLGLTTEEVDDRVSNLLVAGSYVNLNYDDINNNLTISITGLQPSGNYSISGHTHLSTDITDSTSFGRNILTATSYEAQNKLGWQEIDTASWQAKAGGQYFLRPKSLFPTVMYIVEDPVSPSLNDFFTIVKYPSSQVVAVGGVEYASPVIIYRIYQQIGFTNGWVTYTLNSFHTHTSSDITNFNTAVSGLLPVKNIVAGTGIGVTSNSGIYTINSSSTIVSDTLEPDGFVNRTDSIISFNDSSREFNISPKNPAISYSIYNNGVKVVKNTTEIITLPDITALYFIHFDKSTNNLSYKTTSFNFDTDIPIAQIYYNADDNKAVYFGEERHGIRMDASTHRYLHNVFGTQYINGLSISNYTILGNGSNNNDATIAIGNGLIYDEDIEANITHSNTPTNPFEQILYPVAQIPVYYKIGSNGAWTNTIANNFPVKTGTTIQYNLLTGSTWTTENSPNPTNDRYISYWICATTQENAPIISIMGQRIDSSLEQATSNNSWGDLNLNGLPIVELRPLYRLIYDTKNTLTNSPKGFLVNVLDIRGHVDTVTGLTQNDHGSLYGLADDDHYQYMHIDNSRSINAVHTFNNGFNASGLINAVSGNFTSLTVNSTGVSLVGHTHTASNITDFNSSVSGLLPSVSGSGYATTSFANNIYTVSVTGLQPSGNYSTVGHTHTSSNITDFNSSVSGLITVKDITAGSNITITNNSGNYTINSVGGSGSINITNYGNNRILTSDGTTTGIVAESGLFYDPITSNLSLIYDTNTGNINDSALLKLDAYDNSNNPFVGSRIQLSRFRGTQSTPSGVLTNDTLSSIRTNTVDASGISKIVARILTQADGAPTGINLYAPTRMTFHTSSGPNQLDNSLILFSNGKLSYNGYMTIEDGLSAPMPILSLGTVSGNTAINYDYDRQIQKLTLNGTAINFTEGTGWDVANRSMDVILEITVLSTTTVSFDPNFVTDWYNPVPTFLTGKYLVLLRSMGPGIVQGHYIGAKTN